MNTQLIFWKSRAQCLVSNILRHTDKERCASPKFTAVGEEWQLKQATPQLRIRQQLRASPQVKNEWNAKALAQENRRRGTLRKMRMKQLRLDASHFSMKPRSNPRPPIEFSAHS